MATDTDRSYCEWSRNETSDRNDSQSAPLSQLLDQGSISFGRFSVESLSWEKWSVFSHNRWQEELEKFKAPGLVAQKKAYFEEYYKRIRALKTLQADQKDLLTLDSGSNNSTPLDNSPSGTDFSLTSDQQSHDFTVSSPRHRLPQSVDICYGLESHLSCSGQNVAEVEAIIERETDPVDVCQIQYVEPESSASFLDSSSFNVEEVEKDIEQCKHDNFHVDEGMTSLLECSLTSAIGFVTKKNKVVPKGVDLSSKKFEDHASTTKDAFSLTGNSVRLKHRSVCKKEAAASNASNGKLGHRTKVASARSSQELKDSVRKITGNPENKIQSKSAIFNGVSSISKSTSISSYRSPTAVHSNVTVPQTFSLATERWAAPPPAHISDGLSGHARSKPSNRLTRLPVQKTSREISVASSLKDATLGNRRIREEIVGKTVLLDTRHNMPKGRDAEERRLRTMSSNIPCQSKSNQNGDEFGLRSKVRAGKQKEVHMNTGKFECELF